MMAGQVCPCCNKGKIYPGTPRLLLQFDGKAPLEVNRYKKEVLRCNSCLVEFMSNQRIDKWTPSARSTIIVNKVMGIPYNRLADIQAMYNIPVAPSTIWEQMKVVWDEAGKFVYQHLYKLAAECSSFYMDDTRAIILEVLAANKELEKKDRRACNTTAFHAITDESQQIIIYVTDNQHCGENFAKLLEQRKNETDSIITMSDASSNNLSKLAEKWFDKVIEANCNAHGRRKFHSLLDFYGPECFYFLKEIAEIYKNEDHCKVNKYDDLKRLKYHQKTSQKHMDNIYAKIDELFANKTVEPNSSLGKAMRYWQNHKDKLCRFLHVAGVPIDNTLIERVIKSFVLQRKNSYFFKSKDSAAVVSGLTSIVRTCMINQVNPHGYLNWIQENWLKVQSTPEHYMPWHYTEYIKSLQDNGLMAA